ncbi:MAG: DUF501 domain-containing protein [Coriobacteriia bacterium]|nr:DUF501 domain-containing protein [Coriobacteriia bacterium]
MNPDRAVVARQLGREPRGSWSVAARCSHGHPVTITVDPLLEDGSPFPTTWWLTCPHLVDEVGAIESRGGAAAWAARVSSDADMGAAVLAADAAYRGARAERAGGTDPCPGVGIAGQADPCAVKCLHARVAAAIAGIPDPVGEGVVAGLDDRGRECAGDRCSVDVGIRG